MVVNTDHDPSFHVRSPSLENMKLKVAVDIYFCCPFYYYFFFFYKIPLPTTAKADRNLSNVSNSSTYRSSNDPDTNVATLS